MNNKTILYVYVAILFMLTFLLTSRLIKNIKANDFEYVKIVLNVVLLIYIGLKVVKLGKIENDKKE